MTGESGQDPQLEDLAPGHQVERDLESGRFTRTHLTSERAAEIGGNPKKASKAVQDAAEELGDALTSVLIVEDDPRAPALRILIHRLALVASKDTGRSLEAIKGALELVGQRRQATRAPGPGEACKTCGRVQGEEKVRIELTTRVARRMGALMPGTDFGQRLIAGANRLEALRGKALPESLEVGDDGTEQDE